MAWDKVGPGVPGPPIEEHFLEAVWSGGWPSWQRMDRRKKSWARFDGKSTLLLVHGTGMRTSDGFAGIRQDEWRRLKQRYQDRLLAFEHPTIGRGVVSNCRGFGRKLPFTPVSLEFDVLAVSRGGLVSRYLAEGWGAPFLARHRVRFRKIVFLATPNGGTPTAGGPDETPGQGPTVADFRRWRRKVRRWALLGQSSRLVPQAVGGLVGFTANRWLVSDKSIDGAEDQHPGSDLLATLNGFRGRPATAVATADYFAIASSVDTSLGLSGVLDAEAAAAVEGIFDGVSHDLVVPTVGVYQPPTGADPPPGFPIASRFVAAPSAEVTHVGYLRTGAVRHQVLAWLGA